MYTELTCVHSIDSRQVVLVHCGLHPRKQRHQGTIISIMRTFGRLIENGVQVKSLAKRDANIPDCLRCKIRTKLKTTVIQNPHVMIVPKLMVLSFSQR